MKKKLIGILICMLLITTTLSTIGTVKKSAILTNENSVIKAIQFSEIEDENIGFSGGEINNEFTIIKPGSFEYENSYSYDEVLDQNQSVVDGSERIQFMNDGGLAQSFQPSMPTLFSIWFLFTKAEGELEYGTYYVGIKSDIDSPVYLRQIPVEKSIFTPHSGEIWFVWNLYDLSVTPGNTYYIVIYADYPTIWTNQLRWCYGNPGDPYSKGQSFIYHSPSGWSTYAVEGDFCFKTYGLGEPSPYVLGEAIVGFYGPLAYNNDYQDKPTEIKNRYKLIIEDYNDDLCAVLYSNVDDYTFALLQGDEDVKYVQRNYYSEFDAIPTDPDWNLQWGPARIDAPVAWDITQGSTNVRVAVIDTGIDYTHPELGGGFGSRFRVVGGYDWLNDTGDEDTDPRDENGHGTHCAGIIGAIANNAVLGNQGIAGMSWDVSLIAEKDADSWGYSSAWYAAEGITHAVNNVAKVISISQGFKDDDGGFLKQACIYANNQNRVIVNSAGNENKTIFKYPKLYDELVIVVGAINESNYRCTDKDWGFINGDPNKPQGSNYGDELFLVAPGNHIYSTMPTYPVYKTIWGGHNQDFDYLSGTSMACPHVSGVVALMLARNPTLNISEIRCILRETADDRIGDPNEDIAGWDKYYGHGLVNASKAVDAASYGFTIEIDPPLTKEISILPGEVKYTVHVNSLYNEGEIIKLSLDDKYYSIDPLTYEFDPEIGVGDFISELTIEYDETQPFDTKTTRVIGTTDIPGIDCDLIRFSKNWITITSSSIPTNDIVWIKTNETTDTGAIPRTGRLYLSKDITCNNDPPHKGAGGKTLTINISKLGDINVDPGPIHVKPFFNEFSWTIPVKDWPSLKEEIVYIPPGQSYVSKDWYWEIPQAWGEHVCVIAQAWREDTQEDWAENFKIRHNNNIAQRNFFKVGTASPYTTNLSFENPTGKQMNVKVYAEVPNYRWAVDLCQPAKLENGKVVTPMIIPPYTQKNVTLTIIADEEDESGDVTISYEIEGYEENYNDMFIYTFQVNPNDHPNKPIIYGPERGKPGDPCTYTVSAYDPNNDNLYYNIDWNDATYSSVGPYESGDAAEVTHVWNTQGTYVIKTKAIDKYNAESEWATFEVSMPKSYIKNPIIELFMKVLEHFPILNKILNQII